MNYTTCMILIMHATYITLIIFLIFKSLHNSNQKLRMHRGYLPKLKSKKAKIILGKCRPNSCLANLFPIQRYWKVQKQRLNRLNREAKKLTRKIVRVCQGYLIIEQHRILDILWILMKIMRVWPKIMETSDINEAEQKCLED